MLLPAPAVGKHTGTKFGCYGDIIDSSRSSDNRTIAEPAHKAHMQGPVYTTWDCSRCGRLADAADVETGERGAMIYCRACGGWTALTDPATHGKTGAANGQHSELCSSQAAE